MSDEDMTLYDGSKQDGGSGTSRRLSPSSSGAGPRKKRRRRFNVVGFLLKCIGTLLLIAVTTGVILVCLGAVYINRVIMPEARKQDYLGDMSLSLTSTIYYTDENGQTQEYLTLSSDQNRVWVKYSEMPKNLINATIAIEDKRFLSHHGVDWLRTGRGVLNMFTGGSIQGGSTITQQLIKNITGENQVTVKRKITEIFRALEFDKNHSKEQTMEWYLNYIFLGERCYGVGAASYVYFGKDVRELSLAQCASLVGITNNPSRYDPYLNKNAEVTNDQANRKRAKLVLWNMLDQDMITQQEYDDACAEVDVMEFVMGSAEGGKVDKIYTWYQDQVVYDVIHDLMETYDWSEQVAANKVYYGGLSIYCNVDPRVQGIVDEVYNDPANLPYISKSGQQMQSGIVIVDHQGRVVALSGGIGEKTKNRSWSRAFHTKRPPGSSIKPLAVYAPAIEMDYITPYSILDDAPYMEMGGKPWPGNAVGYFKGLDTVSHAVAQSSNTVAVRVLGDYVTVPSSYSFLEDRFHITSLVREKWINNKKFTDMDLAPLALGGLTNGVSPYEMAAAYSVFPSMGRYVEPKTYSRVVDSDGITVLLNNTPEGEYVLKESTAYYMNTLLQGVTTTGTARDAVFDGMAIAGKTGTTTAQKDLWFVGYTPYYTAAVWVGYDRQERLGNIGHPQNILWKQVMSRVHDGLEYKSFPEPSDTKLVTVTYCLDSGMRAGEYCSQDIRGSRVATGVFAQGDEPTLTCDRHTPITVCTADPILDSKTGKETGAYYRAGTGCPEDTTKTVAVLDYVREGAAAEVSVRDDFALLSAYPEAETCHVHTGLPGGNTAFDPADPSTWPLHDPDFNINDPSTWPHTPPDTGEHGGGQSTPSADDPWSWGTQPGGGASTQPAAPNPPNGGDIPPPGDAEPYIPVGG